MNKERCDNCGRSFPGVVSKIEPEKKFCNEECYVAWKNPGNFRMIQEIGKIILKHIVGPDVFYGSDQAAKEIAKLQSDRIKKVGREYLAELNKKLEEREVADELYFKIVDGWGYVKEFLRRMGVENGK